MLVGNMLAHAQRFSSKTALIFNDAPLSYGELARAVSSATIELCDGHVTGRGTSVVAIRDMRVAWIACLALRLLGRTTLVLSSLDVLRALRLSGLRDVVRAKGEAWPGLEAACSSRNLPLLEFALDQSGSDSPPSTAQSEGGHILQTSGTTGLPKHVLLDPSFETAFVQTRIDLLEITTESRFAMFDFPPWTGAGYKSVACTWLAGGTVVMQQQPPFYQMLRHSGLTHGVVTPALLDAVLSGPPDAFRRSERLRLSITGGRVSSKLIERAKARITPHLFSRIGATESSVFAFTPLLTAEDQQWQQPVPGRTKIVDAMDNPVAPGKTGRIRVSTRDGPTGYLDDPDATSIFFRNGWFYPGDLATLRDDGRFMLQGRVTDIINVSGFKVAPAPIEERLCESFGLRGLCLLSMVTADGGEELFVVIESDSPVDTDALGAALRRDLGTFPQAHVFYTRKLPRNAMGKLLRDEVKASVAAQMPS